MEEVHYGDIWFVDTSSFDKFNKTHVQGGIRPYVIVSNERCNETSNVVSAVPLTRSLSKKPLPTHCYIKSLGKLSVALCEQVTCIDKSALLDKAGSVSFYEARDIKIGIMIQLNII